MGRAKSVASLSMRQRGDPRDGDGLHHGRLLLLARLGPEARRRSGSRISAASVLAGTDAGLTPAERALAAWARRVAADPNATTESDLDGLREAGYDDPQILAITLFISLRIAFSTVNDALGALPDRELHDAVPPQVRDVVTWGRPAEK